MYQWWTLLGGTTISFIRVQILETSMFCLINGQTAILINILFLESNKRFKEERSKGDKK